MRAAVVVVTGVGLAMGMAADVGEAAAGGTFEIGFGGGTVTTRVDGKTDTMGAGSSPTIGVGGRLGDRTWLLGRISLVIAKDFTFVFYGGSLQHFVTDRFFVAGGVGANEQDFEKPLPGSMPGTMTTAYIGFAANLRAGVNLFPEYRHTVLLQLELTPTIYRDTQSMGAMLLASYQYL